jgi:hypothetical protein
LPPPAFPSLYNAAMKNQPKTIPTQQEITDACTAIRLNWTAEEFRRRTNASSGGPHLDRASEEMVYWDLPAFHLTAACGQG